MCAYLYCHKVRELQRRLSLQHNFSRAVMWMLLCAFWLRCCYCCIGWTCNCLWLHCSPYHSCTDVASSETKPQHRSRVWKWTLPGCLRNVVDASMVVEILAFMCCSQQRKWRRRQSWKRMNINYSLSRWRKNLTLLTQNWRCVFISLAYINIIFLHGVGNLFTW